MPEKDSRSSGLWGLLNPSAVLRDGRSGTCADSGNTGALAIIWSDGSIPVQYSVRLNGEALCEEICVVGGFALVEFTLIGESVLEWSVTGTHPDWKVAIYLHVGSEVTKLAERDAGRVNTESDSRNNLLRVSGREVVSAPVAAAQPMSAPSVRVLVAAADRAQREELLALLADLGYAVAAAENGRLALQVIRQESFDAVVLECEMPVMDGYSSAAAIRRLPAPANRIAIIAMTGDRAPEARGRCLAAGMDDVVWKPVQSPAIHSALRRLTSEKTWLAGLP